MSEIISDLKYTKSHEWLRIQDDNIATVGITDHAQDALGDIVYVELPEVGAAFGQGQECAVIESVKAAADLYCPVSGEITEVNVTLSDAPETINNSPYENGWIFKIRIENEEQLSELMDDSAYKEACEAE